MVKATINNFESLALSGKTLGNLTYSTRKSVGKRSDTDTAVVNINGSLDTLNIEPQAGFDFDMKSKTPLKLVNGKLLATEARSNGRSAIVQGIQGSLLPLTTSLGVFKRWRQFTNTPDRAQLKFGTSHELGSRTEFSIGCVLDTNRYFSVDSTVASSRPLLLINPVIANKGIVGVRT